MGAAMPLTLMAYYSQSYSIPSRTGSGIPTSNLNKGATFKTSAGLMSAGVPKGKPDLKASPSPAAPPAKGPAIRP